MSTLKRKGVKIVPVILHIGLGSFRPVEVEDLTKHKMDSEYYEIPEGTVQVVNKVIDKKGSVFVCGTSACRALESSSTIDGHLKANRGWTDKFIFPPYDFKITDHLITNFHMPPGRRSNTSNVFVKPFGPHQFFKWLGSVHASNNSSRGASNTRVLTISCAVDTGSVSGAMLCFVDYFIQILQGRFQFFVVNDKWRSHPERCRTEEKPVCDDAGEQCSVTGDQPLT